ncbi:MAG: Holliday junction resolvase RuvX [Rickettsiales bacterium]|nr:Holliday junction resolvase RuvX [Rickettsiales bacterium]
MIFDDLEKFKISLDRGRRLLGMDLGLRRIGLSLSDRDWNIATPKSVLKRGKVENDMKIISTLMAENDVCAVVCGIPLNADGYDTEMSILIRNFATTLDEYLNIPILLQDERLTSFAAEEFLMDGMTRGYRDTKKVIDKVAAAYILQGVLDRI